VPRREQPLTLVFPEKAGIGRPSLGGGGGGGGENGHCNFWDGKGGGFRERSNRLVGIRHPPEANDLENGRKENVFITFTANRGKPRWERTSSIASKNEPEGIAGRRISRTNGLALSSREQGEGLR